MPSTASILSSGMSRDTVFRVRRIDLSKGPGKICGGLRFGVLAGLVLTAVPLSVEMLSHPSLAATKDEASPPTVYVVVKAQYLTLSVRDAPLADVLRAIAQQAEFRLTIAGDLSSPVSWSFSEVTLDQGIRRLVRNFDHVLIYRSDRARSMPRSPAELIVYGAPDGRFATVEPVTKVEPDPNIKPSPLDRVYQGLDRRDRHARLLAVRELARQKDEAAVDDLALVLTHESDTLLRRMAAIGLGSIGGSQALAMLIAALEDKNRLIRAQAVGALGKIGNDEAIAALMGGLRDGDPLVRAGTVRALQKLHAIDLAHILRKVLLDDSSPKVRKAAIRTLKTMRSEAARTALEIGAMDPDPGVSETAALALAAWK